MGQSSFKLVKWYADVIDHKGDGLIAYKAKLSWKSLKVGYEGLIPVGNCKLKSNHRFGRITSPEVGETSMLWKTNQFIGTWRATAPSIKKYLQDSVSGSVTWDCYQPRSHVEVIIGNSRLEGEGYAEKLEATIPPWELPIEKLYWGRYGSERNALVWIQWIGQEPLQLILFNGKEESDGKITSDSVQFGETSLRLPRNTIRKGTLGEIVMSGVKRMARYFPSRILNAQEEKWSGFTDLLVKGNIIDRGSVIHEQVVWP